MTIFEALFLGLIQGLTEFIPVSSTAHLLVGQQLLGLPSGDLMFAFLVIVQLGTVASLIIFYWKDLWKLFRAFFATPFSTPENKLAWHIVIATTPAVVIGYFLRHTVEALFQTPMLEAAIRFFMAAILLTLAEWFGKRTRQLDSMKWFDALIVGFFQVLAVFPGASRSGATISGGMLRGFNRPAAARFAFLMSVPIMLGTGGYQIFDVMEVENISQIIPAILVGLITSAIVGWFAIRWLMAYLSQHSLYVFAGYCFIAGVLVSVV